MQPPPDIVSESELLMPLGGSESCLHIDAVLKAAKDCGFAALRIVAAGEAPGAEVAAQQYFGWNSAIHKVKLARHFSRAQLINYAAFLSSAPFIAMLDSDILLRREFVHEASYALAEHKRRLILPKVRYLSQSESADVLSTQLKYNRFCYPSRRPTDFLRSPPSAGVSKDGWPLQDNRENGCRIRTASMCGGKQQTKIPAHSLMDCNGGFMWMRRKDFLSLGGLRCEFEGWGFEEDEFAWRVKRRGFSIQRPECELYHLWHERSQRKAEGYYKKRDENRRIYERIKSADDFALAFKFEGLEVLDI